VPISTRPRWPRRRRRWAGASSPGLATSRGRIRSPRWRASAARVEHTQHHFLYSTAKAALLKFTLHLVRDLPGIRANTIVPGWVDTPIYRRAGLDQATIEKIYEKAVTRVPAGRIGTPADIAHAVLFLSSEKASYINGATLDINGGWLCNADWGFLF